MVRFPFFGAGRVGLIHIFVLPWGDPDQYKTDNSNVGLISGLTRNFAFNGQLLQFHCGK